MTEEDYLSVGEWATYPGYSDQERIALEYVDLFVTNHTAMDDEFWARLRSLFSDEEIHDLAVSAGTFLAMGRITQVFDVQRTCPVRY